MNDSGKLKINYRMGDRSINQIRNIVFDLGGVLLDLDFQAPVEAFRKLGGEGYAMDYHQVITHPLFYGFETGEITPGEFRKQVKGFFAGMPLSDEAIDMAWCSMLLNVPESKINLLKELSEKYRLFLFSNTNEIHIAFFQQRFEAQAGYPIESLFEQCFYSHRIHDRKPNLSSFMKISRLANIRPEETLFVDDFAENIRAARECGFKTIHYQPGDDLTSIMALFSDGNLRKDD